jgi:hypothetical protein
MLVRLLGDDDGDGRPERGWIEDLPALPAPGTHIRLRNGRLGRVTRVEMLVMPASRGEQALVTIEPER